MRRSRTGPGRARWPTQNSNVAPFTPRTDRLRLDRVGGRLSYRERAHAARFIRDRRGRGPSSSRPHHCGLGNRRSCGLDDGDTPRSTSVRRGSACARRAPRLPLPGAYHALQDARAPQRMTRRSMHPFPFALVSVHDEQPQHANETESDRQRRRRRRLAPQTNRRVLRSRRATHLLQSGRAPACCADPTSGTCGCR